MYTNRAIVFAALAAGASAQLPNLLPRQTESATDLPTSTEFSPECITSADAFSNDFPTPGPALADALSESGVLSEDGPGATGVAGLCRFASVLPEDQRPAYSSYIVDIYSYMSEQSSNMVWMASSCNEILGAPAQVITSELHQLLSQYSEFSVVGCGPTTSASSGVATTTVSDNSASQTTSATEASNTSASSTGSSTGSQTSGAPTAIPTNNAGQRQTGMIAAAAVAAGFVGAAVML